MGMQDLQTIGPYSGATFQQAEEMDGDIQFKVIKIKNINWIFF